MTFEPRFWNSLRTSWLAPCPIDTMVVTAAMPMTTPSTVSPERSLFLASVRKEMMSRSTRSMALPRCVGALRPGHHRLVFAELASQEFRKLAFDQPERNGDGPQQLPVLGPNN